MHTMSFLGTSYFSGLWFFFQLSIALVASFYASLLQMSEIPKQEQREGNADDSTMLPGTYAYP
jgi:hypothetical protein